MLYDITFLYQHAPLLVHFGLSVWFRLKYQIATQVAKSKYLFGDEIEQSLLQELTASDQGSVSDESDSSGTDDLTLGEAEYVLRVIPVIYLRGRT
jgi:hypothetical protein